MNAASTYVLLPLSKCIYILSNQSNEVSYSTFISYIPHTIVEFDYNYILLFPTPLAPISTVMSSLIGKVCPSPLTDLYPLSSILFNIKRIVHFCYVEQKTDSTDFHAKFDLFQKPPLQPFLPPLQIAMSGTNPKVFPFGLVHIDV